MLSMRRIFSYSALFISAASFGWAQVTATHEGKQVIFRTGDREILRYQAEAGELPRADIPEQFIRGGYIQSIYTPDGKLITDDFPSDHAHHHGIWNPWTKTEFEGRKPDFWNMGAKTGKVDFVALDEVWNKDGKAGLTARHQFIDLTTKPPKTALLETWNLTVSVEGGNYVIDFTSTQKCAGESPLKLPEYHYGGLGFRGNAQWKGKANCHFMTASGLRDRVKVNTSREKWCWVGGKTDGKMCGITILGHPGNFRFPQPVRANPDDPFFCFAPQQAGEMTISPGESYVARYRFVVQDGKPTPSEAEKWWKSYSEVR